MSRREQYFDQHPKISLALLTACAAAEVVLAHYWIGSTWDGSILPAVGAFAAVGAIYFYRRKNRLDR